MCQNKSFTCLCFALKNLEANISICKVHKRPGSKRFPESFIQPAYAITFATTQRSCLQSLFPLRNANPLQNRLNIELR